LHEKEIPSGKVNFFAKGEKMKVENAIQNNLFFYATSELSQDAFICWLLSHAMPKFLEQDKVLAECAKELIRLMLTNRGKSDKVVVTNIKKQYKNIDILVVVNRDTYIVIEDKTFTGQHDNQINRYAATVRADFSVDPVCVYYKVVEQPHPEEGVVNITRADLLSIFRKYDSGNQIYKDYVTYLEHIESRTNAYKTEPISQWDGYAYRGFFTHLMKEVICKEEKNSWGYVSNPNGGFWGLWWNWISSADLTRSNLREEWLDSLYLQIEGPTIAVKIYATNTQDNSITRDIRRQLYEYLKQKLADHNFTKRTFRPGISMSIGHIEYSEKDYMEKIKMMEAVMQKIADGDFVYSEK
jgi:hypothetical protein